MDGITLHNYEAFFVLYMDGELDEEGAKSVEDFLIIHPHLQDEMDALLSTKLQPETFSFNKEGLFADSMKQAGLTENLLLYMDGELDDKSRKALELELKLNDSLLEEYKTLLQTKLPAEVIPYPNKEELYRRTGIISISFLFRAAAVILLVLFGSLMLLNNKGAGEIPPVSVAVKPGAPSVEKKNEIEIPQSVSPIEENTIAASTPVSTQEKNSGKAAVRKEVISTKNVVSENAVASNTTSSSSNEVTEPSMQRPTTLPQGAFTLNDSYAVNIQPENISPKSDVTFAQPLRNTTEEQVIAVSNESKAGGLKTFFKKATRVIAQTARLDLATGEDKVLIAAIAVDLK